MYTNANIKSIDEALKRLMAGEVFYKRVVEEINEIKIFYDKNDQIYPFKKTVNGTTSSYIFTFSDYKEWLIPVKWYEKDISKGILCYVSDTSENYLYRHKASVAIICDYNSNNDFKFMSNNGECWRYAKTISPSEVKKFIHNANSINIEDSQV